MAFVSGTMSASRCRFCDHDNPDGARFCNSCGSPLYLKPCPRCEAVNDTAAEQCYECGAALETGASSPALAATEAPIPADVAHGEHRHVPESFGARLADLAPIEAHGNVAAAERRNDFERSGRSARVAFFIVVLTVFGALGYYGYRNRTGPDSEVAVVAASAQSENQQPFKAEQGNAATPASISENAEQSAPTKPVDELKTSPPAGETTAESSINRGGATDVKTAPQPRPAARAVGKVAPPQRAHPAPASDASAIATQRVIERELGIRVVPSSPRPAP